jgi:hypothetical protein
MKIMILLDPGISEFGPLETDLKNEINALSVPGVSITTKTGPPPEGTLVLDQVSQFIIEHSEELRMLIPLAQAAFQVVLEVLRRRGMDKPKAPAQGKVSQKTRGKKTKKRTTKKTPTKPAILFDVDGHTLELPCSEQRQRRFLLELQRVSAGKQGVDQGRRKSGANKTKGRK